MNVTKVMLDTNVVLDVMLEREPFFPASYEVIRQAVQGKIEVFVSAAAATDIFYLLSRNLKDKERAKNSTKKLLRLVRIADALAEDVLAAFASGMADVEDALVAAIAERCGMACIVTRNAPDYVASPVAALTPEAFLRHIEAAYGKSGRFSG